MTAGDNGGPAEFALTGSFTLVVAAIVFGLVVPRAQESGRLVRSALILTALSVLGGVFFFSGLAQITAPAAMLLGYIALDRDGASRARCMERDRALGAALRRDADGLRHRLTRCSRECTSAGRTAPGASSCQWSQPGSNRRPLPCKGSALPTELWPRRNQG